MLKSLEVMAGAVVHKPHSFDHIRSTTGTKLTDEQFLALVEKNRGKFKLVHFVKHDDEGKPILPGRPGVRMRANRI